MKLALVVVALFGFSLQAMDRIILTTGQAVEGDILIKEDDGIIVKVKYGTMKVATDKIDTITTLSDREVALIMENEQKAISGSDPFKARNLKEVVRNEPPSARKIAQGLAAAEKEKVADNSESNKPRSQSEFKDRAAWREAEKARRSAGRPTQAELKAAKQKENEEEEAAWKKYQEEKSAKYRADLEKFRKINRGNKPEPKYVKRNN